MRFIGIIPARYASSRFPGKPLAVIHGKTMVQRVYEQAKKSASLSQVVVATDDERIHDHVKSFGGHCVMTSVDHPSGTDRCFEALQLEGKSEYDVVVNIQGDEPFIDPGQIDLACACFDSSQVQIATLVKKITSLEELQNINTPKVISDIHGRAIYFSRTPLPYCRGKEISEWLNLHTYYKHIGLYAYRTDILEEITALKPSALELAESLEQLRWIEHGYKIRTAITLHESIAIDNPSDLDKLLPFT